MRWDKHGRRTRELLEQCSAVHEARRGEASTRPSWASTGRAVTQESDEDEYVASMDIRLRQS